MFTDYNYQRLIEQLRRMSAWQIIVAAAVTAEKAIPIVRSLALPDTRRVAERSLALTWRSISDSESNSERASQFLDEVNSAPELQCEYPDTLAFFVSKPLDLIRLALGTITMGSPSEMVENVGFSHILDVADELDVAASVQPDLVSDRLEIRKAEQLSQISVVGKLAEYDTPSDELVESVREESRSISTLIKLALPTYCYSFVYDLCRSNSD